MIQNAFTCTGPYAILILCGIKRTENRSAWPEPREGRAGISCSKSFCKEEYGRFIAWASVSLPPEDFERLPAWREVKDWPGMIVGVCDYNARERNGNELWDKGYQYWWDLSNVMRMPKPIPCRGKVGMWPLPPSIAQSVVEQVHGLQTVNMVEANGAAVRIETADDAYPFFRAAIPIAGAREGFFVLPIDKERRPICKPILVSRGHIHGTAAIKLREVFREAFKVDADAIIVAHNHPSGDPTPSKADIAATREMRDLARRLGIVFLDHFVIGSGNGDGFVSLAELEDWA